jgi:hypothetical protein
MLDQNGVAGTGLDCGDMGMDTTALEAVDQSIDADWRSNKKSA